MKKLIHASEALKIANKKHSFDDQLEYVNTQIENAARNGEFSVRLKLQDPENKANTIIRLLRQSGYEVLYSDIDDTHVTIRVWWV